MFSSSGQGQTSYVPSEGISCKELAASGNEHLLKPGGENRHGDGVDDKEEEEDANINKKKSERPVDALAVKKYQSPTDNLKSRDASASKKLMIKKLMMKLMMKKLTLKTS